MTRCSASWRMRLFTMTIRSRTKALALATLLPLAACGPDLRFERDAAMPIPAGSTWTWSRADDDGLAPDDGALIPSDSLATMIAAAIEAELVARGFPKAAPDSATFIVHYHLGRRTVTDTMPLHPDRNPSVVAGEVRSGWGRYGQPEDVEGRTVTWEEGMLIVDVLPRDRSTVAWRGIIAGAIPEEAAKRPGEAIAAAVRRLLRDFPEG